MLQLVPGVGSTSAQRVLDHMMASVNPIRALVDVPSPPRAGDNWISFVTRRADLMQLERAIIFGVTAALYGEITLKDGRVEQTNFDTYQEHFVVPP